MKLQELLLKLNKGAIGSTVLEEFANSQAVAIVKDDIADEEADKIITKLNSLISIEQATEHPEIVNTIKQKYYPQHKKTALEEIEKLQIKAVKDIFGDEGMKAIEGEEFAKERQEKINELFKTKFEELKTAGGKGGDEKVQEYAKKYNELLAKFEEAENGYTEKLGAKEQEYKTALTKRAFVQKAINQKWADQFDDRVKHAITRDLFDELSGEAAVKLNDKDEIELFNKESQELPYHPKGANKPINLDGWLETKLQPYIKRNNNGDDDQGKNNPNPDKKKFAGLKREYAPGSMAAERAAQAAQQ